MFISGHFIGGSWSSRSVFSRQGFLGIYTGRRESLSSNSHTLLTMSMLVPKIPESAAFPLSILDVPGQCLKVRHEHVARGILYEVIIRGLTGRHRFGDGAGGGGGWFVLCCVDFFVMCDVA